MHRRSISVWSLVATFAVVLGMVGTGSAPAQSAPPKNEESGAPGVKAADPSIVRPVPLVEAAKLANANVTGPKADVGRIDPASIPPGQTSIDGVPFEFLTGEKNALDVAASMNGMKEPFRNKHAYVVRASISGNGRLVFAIPGDQYSALHLIAFSAGRAGHAPRLTVRVGRYGDATGILEDIVVNVPTLTSNSNEGVVGRRPVKLADGKSGFLHHLRVPLPQSGNVKEFNPLDLEFTRDLNVHILPPDPDEFGTLPAGLPSDVVVLAATLEPSPITMTYVTAEHGNVFFDTQKVVFKLSLSNRSEKPVSVRAYADAIGPGTGEEVGVERKTTKAEQKIQLKPGERQEMALDVTPGKRGWFACTLGVEADGRLVQRRDTTYAVLAPDTRKAFADSPFGVWEFWHPHSAAKRGNQVEILASLIHKGGWRWTYGGQPERAEDTSGLDKRAIREKYKIVWTTQALPESYQRGEGWYNEAEFNKTMPGSLEYGVKTFDPNFKVMHESRSSLNLVRRYSEFLGGKPYDMPAYEKATLEKQFENVKKYCLGVKRIHPQAKIVLFNDYPAVVFQYLSRGFPKEAFDVIGLEGANFLRQPERQPDWLSLLGNMHETKRAMAKYGYDKPIWTTEALYHPSEAGALSLHDQGVIAVREAMMALQLGISRMTAAGILKDPSDDYHWSNWGSSGYCFRDPEINPKPSYAMYAWLTQLLDQAKPAGKVATPNTSLHVVDFMKPDGSHVYGIWTVNGVQTVTLSATTGKPMVYDAFGNSLAVKGDGLTLSVSPTPLYITGATLAAVTTAIPVEPKAEIGKQLFDFDKPEQFQASNTPNKVVESNWDTPRIMGSFETSFVEEDGATAIKVALKPDQDERKLLPRYVEYQLAQPIVLEDRPYQFALRVKGNSGWGRIMFEVIDAKGRVWTSSGNQYAGACNAADPSGDSFVSFEGWQTMRIPIVGMYPGKDQSVYWPRNYNWWPTNSPEEAEVRAKAAEAAAKQAAPPRWMGQVPVDYPLKLTKLIVSMRPSILYLDEERPVANPVIFIDKLGVTSPPAGM